ncbi:Spindle pole body component alp14 [Smittium culicis]|uniref:Spindle pole body component alp14 n=1 Tax=Smittium culicis TaxID=133412 RepID=A0A1R1X8P8_9FUNG|nr:Spindle pole body component alp14 [Smittium culicis]
MADENEDYSSLPLKTRLAHKIWKVRLNAYTEAEKLFSTIDPDTEAYVFNEYEPFLKKIASDANVAALEAGIGAVLKFVENTPNPTSPRDSILEAILEKCLASTRAGVKTKSLELSLLLCEIDTPNPVIVFSTFFFPSFIYYYLTPV